MDRVPNSLQKLKPVYDIIEDDLIDDEEKEKVCKIAFDCISSPSRTAMRFRDELSLHESYQTRIKELLTRSIH